MKEVEANNQNKDILIHTDITANDENLNIINNSFFYYQRQKTKINKLNQLLNTNIVTGCTCMIYKELLELIDTENNNAITHDWWIELTAACFGEIYCLDKQLFTNNL